MKPTSKLIELTSLVPSPEVIVAGWTGRNAAGVRHHIEELSALGVPPPTRTPSFYRVSGDRLTQADEITVVGPNTSGEVEPVLIWTDAGTFVGVGSDHTDRESERFGVALSKQLCPKVLGREYWPYDDVSGHWDQLILRSFRITGGDTSLYQEGTLATLLPAEELARQYQAEFGAIAAGTVLFCGTVPTLGGVRSANTFVIELHDPVTGASLSHRYRVRELPLIS